MPTDDTIGTSEAIAKLGYIRQDTLDQLVKRGSLPCSWAPNAYGQRVRRFRPQDVEAYAERRKAALRDRLARLEGTTA